MSTWTKDAWDHWYCGVLSNRETPEVFLFKAHELKNGNWRGSGVTVAGYYASIRKWSSYVGPFEKLIVAKNVALYLDPEQEPKYEA